MKKKIFIAIVVIIIIVIGLSISYALFMQNHFKVGEEYFIKPNGYVLITDDQLPGITNGKNSIFINFTKDKNINESIQEYLDIKTTNKTTVKITELNISDHEVFKAKVGNNTPIFHYWFEKNNVVYKISTWTGDENTDIIVSELIKSVIN